MRPQQSSKYKKLKRADGLPKEFRLRRNKATKPNFKPTVATGSELMVRSNFEKKAVEFFERQKIKYQYEPLMLLGGKQYRPDFFLPEQKLFIELCGMNHLVYYRQRQDLKKRLYKKYNLKALFIDCHKLSDVDRELAKALTKHI